MTNSGQPNHGCGDHGPKFHAAAVAVILGVTTALYWRTLGNPLVFDDFSPEQFRRFGEAPFDLQFRWLSYSSFAWVENWFGASLAWQRLVNLSLHALAASTLYVLFWRLFGIVGVGGPDRRWAARMALAGALWFAMHPAAVYGVAYLIQRSILMATLFAFVMLACYLEGVRRSSPPWLLASAVFYFLSVSSKEHAIMLPAVALAMTALFPGKANRLRATVRELWVPLVLFAAIAVATVLQAREILGVGYEPYLAQMEQPVAAPSEGRAIRGAWFLSVVNQASLFFKYILIWAVPWTGWMAVDLRAAFPGSILAWPQAIGACAFAIYGLCALALQCRARNALRLLGFAMLFPWLLFATEFSTVRLQEPFVLYRSYLWMGILPAALPALLGGRARAIALPLMVALCLGMLPATLDRLQTFSDRIALWDDAERKNRDKGLLGSDRHYTNRGQALFDAGRFSEALRDFDASLRIRPENNVALVGRIQALAALGRIEEARRVSDRAIQENSGVGAYHAARCFVDLRADALLEARHECGRALALDPANADAAHNLRLVQERLRSLENSLDIVETVLTQTPERTGLHLERARLARKLGLAEKTRESYRRACALGEQMVCEEHWPSLGLTTAE